LELLVGSHHAGHGGGGVLKGALDNGLHVCGVCIDRLCGVASILQCIRRCD
jgi:hypothetical protein